MKIQDLKNYGKALSDSESSISPELMKKATRISKGIVTKHLGFWQLFRFLFLFLKEKRRMARVDLSEIREKGMINEKFIGTQIEMVALFSALAQIKGKGEAIKIMREVMDGTAPEMLGACFPSPEDLKTFPDPFGAFQEYSLALPEAAQKAGCNTIEIAENSKDALQLDMTSCAWCEIATKLGYQEACQPNCYADEVFFPEYLKPLGIRYKRTGTLAEGDSRCQFRFERRE